MYVIQTYFANTHIALLQYMIMHLEKGNPGKRDYFAGKDTTVFHFAKMNLQVPIHHAPGKQHPNPSTKNSSSKNFRGRLLCPRNNP